MESINMVKGYDKVNTIPADSHHHPKLAATHRRKTAILSLLILVSLLVVTAISVLIYKSTTTHKSKTNSTTAPYPPPSAQSNSLNTTESTRLVCSVTQYPNSCVSSFSSLKNLPPQLGPQLIFTLSLQISLSELKNVSALPKTLIAKSNEANTVSALRDCASLFDDAVSQLSNSVALIVDGSEKELLTEANIANVNTWISGAMSDQETCLDGLEEMQSSVLDEVKSTVQMSKECMSNSLAILANMHSLLDKFGQTQH